MADGTLRFYLQSIPHISILVHHKQQLECFPEKLIPKYNIDFIHEYLKHILLHLAENPFKFDFKFDAKYSKPRRELLYT